MTDSTTTPDFIPFESIGLCFSGGGYRASAFALGVLSYLNRVKLNDKPLLQKVDALSTVSGGTLTGMAYAVAQVNRVAFNQFYKSFYQFLQADKLTETAIGFLNEDALWKTSHKKRSLINAFALAYEQLLVQGTFEQFVKDSPPHLKQVCFNATDFSFGLAFRFQNTGLFGNKPLNCAELNAIKDQVHVADAVASSSCFPFGFEPMIFPDDYFDNHNTADYKALKRRDQFLEGAGIMDGGIVDNQGIGSMINMGESKKRARKPDLIIVNDVGSYRMQPWLPGSGMAGKKKSLRETVLDLLKFLNFRWYYWALLLAGVLTLVLNSMLVFGQQWSALYIVGGILTGVGLILTTIGLLTSMAKKVGLAWFDSVVEKKVPPVLLDEVASLAHLDVGLVRNMTSTFKMVNDIFLKQIRRLNYDLLYSKPELKNRVITSTVYQLNGKPSPYKNQTLNPAIPAPGERLQAAALVASETPTTLWWDEKDLNVQRQDNLIACGQFTTCYNLMDYILKLKESGGVGEELNGLSKQLETDWKKFNENSFFIVSPALTNQVDLKHS
jgi:predicted acylesterase/phospholipase RssA